MKRAGVRPKGRSMWGKIRKLLKKRPGYSDAYCDPDYGLYTENYFHALLHREEARSARSGKVCLLMLLDIAGLEDRIVSEVASIILSVSRETDVKGWWRSDAQIGILFTEIDAPSREAFVETEKAIKAKILKWLSRELSSRIAERIALSSRMFPEPPPQGFTRNGRQNTSSQL